MKRILLTILWGASLIGAGFFGHWVNQPDTKYVTTLVKSPPVASSNSSSSSFVTLRHRATATQSAQGQGVNPVALENTNANVALPPLSTQDPLYDWEITLGASATSSATASSPVLLAQSVQEPARLGLVLGTYPDHWALDYRTTELTIHRWIFGNEVKLGLDVEANFSHAGIGTSVGDKGFVAGSYWTSYDLKEQGVSGGVGLRF